MGKTVEEVYGVQAVRGYDPARAAEARECWRPADLSALGEVDSVHPYYLEKAEKLRRDACFEPDADMRWLALWGERVGDLPVARSIALADSSGTIWGFATPALSVYDVESVSAETCDRLELDGYGAGLCPELGKGLGMIERRICRPVVVVRPYVFSGPSEFGERKRAEREEVHHG